MSIVEMWAYVKNGLPHPTAGQLIALFAAMSTVSKGIEDFLGKKSFGNWIWKGVKAFFTWPSDMKKSHLETKVMVQEMQNKLTQVSNEVTINGGTKLMRDIVLESKVRHESNAKTLSAILMRLQVREELDMDMLFTMDIEGNFSLPNRAFLSFFGYSEGDIKNREWQQRIPPDDMAKVTPRLHFSLRFKAKFESDHRMISNDGTCHECRITAIPYKDPCDDQVKFVGKIEVLSKK